MVSSDQITVLHLVGGKSFHGGTASVVRDLTSASASNVSNWIWMHRDCPEELGLPFIRRGSSEKVNASIVGDLVGAVRDLRAMLRTIKESQIEILHAHTRLGIFAGWLSHQFSGMPLIIHLHFLAGHSSLYRFLIRTANAAVIYNSRQTAEHFRAAMETATIVMPTVAWPSTNLPESSAPRVVAASAILPHKHLDIVIAGCERLINDGCQFETLICGITPQGSRGSLERAIIEIAKEKGFIRLEQWNRDWTKTLEDQDVFVHLGQPESFGLVILEAFVRGLRLVVLPNTFLDDLPDDIRDKGIHRASSLCPNDVADAIGRALKDSQDCQSLRALRSAVEPQFSKKPASEKVKAVYCRLRADQKEAKN